MSLSVQRGIRNHGAVKAPWLTGLMVVATAVFHLGLGPAAEGLLYQRQAIAGGELWRLVSGHFVHCDSAHLIWNLAAMGYIGGLLERRIGARLIEVVLVSCLGVSCWLWFMKSSLAAYCGLSGMLNGLLAVLLALLWKELRHPLVPLVAAGSLLKIAVESAGNQSLLTNLSWEAVPGAHGAGFTAGLLFLLISEVRIRTLSLTQPP